LEVTHYKGGIILNIQTGINIHNRFDIEVRDSVSNRLKQEITAYNIVLTSMWSRLVNLQTYFTNIHFGTGTGTLSAARTTLFNYLGTKAAANTLLTKALPISSWRRQIVLNPEEFVGSVITEVGISFDSAVGSLVTHALLRDSEGNTISITKTATDIVTIYATVFVTFATQDSDKIKFVGMPNNNGLVNYLIGNTTFPSCSFTVGDSDEVLASTNKQIICYYSGANGLGASPGIAIANWIKDVANKKLSTPVAPNVRLGTTVGNGHIKEIGFGNSSTPSYIFRSVLPIPGIFEGQPYSGVIVGTGDGTTREYILPSKNLNDSSIIIKKDGTPTSLFSKVAAASDINYTNGALGVSDSLGADGLVMSLDGLILVVGCGNYSGNAGYLLFHDRVDGNWVRRAVSPTLPAGQSPVRMSSRAFSSNNLVFAVALQNSPYVAVYDWTGGVWVKRIDPSPLPAGGNYCSLSLDGLILAVAYNTSPYISVYDWTGGAWVKRANPTVLPTGAATGCYLSDDGLIVVVCHYTSPYISVYDWTGGAWVKRANPTVLPTATASKCFLSSNNLVLSVVYGASPILIVYDWVGGVWVKRIDPSAPPLNTYVAVSINGDSFACSRSTTPFFDVIDWTGNTWVRRNNTLNILPPSTGSHLAFSGDSNMLCFVTSESTYGYLRNIFNYDVKKRQTKIIFDTAPALGVALTADYTVNGIHKTDQFVIDLGVTIQYGEGA
jgi:hypothetical protein